MILLTASSTHSPFLRVTENCLDASCRVPNGAYRVNSVRGVNKPSRKHLMDKPVNGTGYFPNHRVIKTSYLTDNLPPLHFVSLIKVGVEHPGGSSLDLGSVVKLRQKTFLGLFHGCHEISGPVLLLLSQCDHDHPFSGLTIYYD